MRWYTRAAVVADAEEIARINVASWHSAYRGIVPDAVLDGVRVHDRVERWRDLTGQRPGDVRVAVDEDGRLGAYCVIGPERKYADGTEPRAELSSVYGDPAYHGTGAGHAVHTAGLARMVELGFRIAVLWVLRDNTRARRFYAAHGWVEDGKTGVFEVDGAELPELRYVLELPVDQPIG